MLTIKRNSSDLHLCCKQHTKVGKYLFLYAICNDSEHTQSWQATLQFTVFNIRKFGLKSIVPFLVQLVSTIHLLTLECTDCAPQPGYLSFLHNLGAGVSFMCICFYTVMLTALTRKCVLTGYEKVLYPLRIISTVAQIIVTISCILL